METELSKLTELQLEDRLSNIQDKRRELYNEERLIDKELERRLASEVTWVGIFGGYEANIDTSTVTRDRISLRFRALPEEFGFREDEAYEKNGVYLKVMEDGIFMSADMNAMIAFLNLTGLSVSTWKINQLRDELSVVEEFMSGLL